MTGLVVDLFAGGGGASVGVEAALGRPIDVAINHDPVALAVHRQNHPKTRHLTSDIWEVKPQDATQGAPVELLWASPDCTHFSVAKGATPRKKKIRSLAWVVVRWAREVRPQMICVENVPEFQGWGPLSADGRPNQARKGETFRRWVRQLQTLGYEVEWRVLDASTFGAPTKRRRLFIVARCDGEPISWPEATHGPGTDQPLRTAAECIDWTLPCPSIFQRSRPLAEKTCWRIAQGIRRFVLESASPFIVKVNHGRWEARTESLGEPLSTITAERRGHALVSPTLIQTGYGERPGQRARVPGLEKPIGTLVDGQKHALIAAFLSKHYGDPRRKRGGGVVLGSELDRPIGTVTARDHHSGVAVRLEPAPAMAGHVEQVRAFLTAYYGSDWSNGQTLLDPMRTIRAQDCLGLVTVRGVDYQITDIGLRMLQPHELLQAQFGDFATDYSLAGATTKRDQVRLIGNSVCPNVAQALVAANTRCSERAAA